MLWSNVAGGAGVGTAAACTSCGLFILKGPAPEHLDTGGEAGEGVGEGLLSKIYVKYTPSMRGKSSRVFIIRPDTRSTNSPKALVIIYTILQ